jgi:hypothetical protein
LKYFSFLKEEKASLIDFDKIKACDIKQSLTCISKIISKYDLKLIEKVNINNNNITINLISQT